MMEAVGCGSGGDVDMNSSSATTAALSPLPPPPPVPPKTRGFGVNIMRSFLACDCVVMGWAGLGGRGDERRSGLMAVITPPRPSAEVADAMEKKSICSDRN